MKFWINVPPYKELQKKKLGLRTKIVPESVTSSILKVEIAFFILH